MSKEKFAGLCIVHRNCNYGSILQSFATLVKLEELGISYEIIDYRHPKTIGFYVKALGRLASRDTLYSKVRSLKRKAGKILHKEYAANDRKRQARFGQFIKDNFSSFSKPVTDYSELQAYAGRFSDVLVGSDQLWLPSGLGTNFYNLMFVPDDVNKIAYSASFGVSAIPKYQENRTREYLNRIEHISLREESGQRIVKVLTGRDAPVILDPTMIITREQWDKEIEDRIIVEGDYIFCYFLGNNPEHRNAARELSEKTGLKIVVLRHLDEYIPEDENFGDIAPYDIGPAEFVNLIRHARYVCTDSFHGSVFSIIYHKQFVSFNRYSSGTNSRNSRLDTLFGNIGISRRYAGDIYRDISADTDWESVDENLEILRKKSHSFIYNAFFGDGEKHTEDQRQRT